MLLSMFISSIMKYIISFSTEADTEVNFSKSSVYNKNKYQQKFPKFPNHRSFYNILTNKFVLHTIIKNSPAKMI